MHGQLQTILDRAWQDIAANGCPLAIGVDAAANEDNWGVCILILSADLQSAQMPILLPQQRINATGQVSPTLLCRPTKQVLLRLLEHITSLNLPASIGVDVPFGWPDAHREFVEHWTATGGWLNSKPIPDRTDFETRLCDIELRKRYPFIRPLAVGADTIAQAAFCWSQVRQELGQFPIEVDVGLSQAQQPLALFETYPGAFVKLSVSDFGNYKRKPEVRRELLRALRTQYDLALDVNQTDWLDWSCEQRGSPDAFDSFLCALTAWDHLRHRRFPGSVSLTTPSTILHRPVTTTEAERINREGWILVRNESFGMEAHKSPDS